MPKITIQHPDGTSSRFGLNGRAFTVGRAENNDIVLQDNSSSGSHAVLKLTDSGDFMVTDLESTNLTRVNGVPVTSQLLRDGDTLQFAETHAVYESEYPAVDDQPTQVYERSPSVSATAPQVRPAAGNARPVYVIQRPVSTMGGRRRSANSGQDGCFTVFLLCVLVPALFIAGMVVRHFQDNKGTWLWSYLKEYIYG